jgi:hypothetical protein
MFHTKVAVLVHREICMGLNFYFKNNPTRHYCRYTSVPIYRVKALPIVDCRVSNILKLSAVFDLFTEDLKNRNSLGYKVKIVMSAFYNRM